MPKINLTVDDETKQILANVADVGMGLVKLWDQTLTRFKRPETQNDYAMTPSSGEDFAESPLTDFQRGRDSAWEEAQLEIVRVSNDAFREGESTGYERAKREAVEISKRDAATEAGAEWPMDAPKDWWDEAERDVHQMVADAHRAVGKAQEKLTQFQIARSKALSAQRR